MQIKTTVRYHLTPIRKAANNNNKIMENNKSWQRYREIGSPWVLLGGKWCSHYGKQYIGSLKN